MLHVFQAALLEVLDLLEQAEQVRLPRVVPRDRENPFTSLSEDDFIERYRLSPGCVLELLEEVEPRLPKAQDGRGKVGGICQAVYCLVLSLS